MVKTAAFSLVALASPTLAATSPDGATALRCEVVRRDLEADLRDALLDCRRRDAEAEARHTSFGGTFCRSGAQAAMKSALAADGCLPEASDATPETMATTEAAPSERAELALPGGGREVTFERTSGLAVLQGDIVLGKVADGSSPRDLESTSSFSVSNASLIWPNATIPYAIDPPTPDLVRERILSAIDHWNTTTLIRLRPRTAADPDVVLFFSQEPSCWAELGRQGGVQLANLGTACVRGNAIHEIGHAVGLLHEHARPDRDSYVAINWNHIDPAQRPNFEIISAPMTAYDSTLPAPYDIRSMMHYGSFAASMDGSPTIVRTNGETFTENREALTPLDVSAVTGLVLERAGTKRSKLVMQSSGQCLSSSRVPRRVGAPARLRGCLERLEASWYVYSDPHSGNDLLVNGATRQCLSIPGASTASDVQARLLPCNGGDEQRLDVTRLPGGGLQIRSAKSGLCIGSVDSTGRERPRIVQAPCTGSAAQVWNQL